MEGLPVDLLGKNFAGDEGARLIAFAAAAGEVLSASMEPEVAISRLARLPVPELADWSMVTIVDDEGQLKDVDTWHRDPIFRPATVLFAQHRLTGITRAVNGVTQAASSREPVYVRERVDELAISRLQSAEAIDAMRILAPHSAAFLPLLHADRLVGVLTLYRGPDRPVFTPAEETTVEIIGRRAAIALLNAMQMRQHRDVSEELQRSMLTATVQPSHLEVVARYRPANEAVQVGGDWYDAFVQHDGRSILVIGDVVGHDIASAAVMGQLRNLMRGIAVATGASPSELLTQVDRALVTLEMPTIATALVMRVEDDTADAGTLRVQWSNAGHPPPLVCDPDGQVRQLDAHGLLLGIDAESPRADDVTTMGAGATLLLFTDGLVERRREHLEHSLTALRDRLSALRSLPLEELVTGLLPDEHEDDIAVLAVRFHPERRDRVPEGR
ncbi:PP2C family protein-serine/threonine phosphatase [Aeromicrobium stalagmiti]|uniref:PP2C family protein-serine/threonine phosphatase n=1 Tax=Aeromicrobium stalagmiti TaxID=2738988 RepID=UPI00156A656A|nr:GAF domain-containing SpoIIE family protein phosphatase [Aeromicrobium stalagmiti]NRQ50983.1 SpoIIE family protein phosphatase [Aeromicrobium stalagmiti]